MFVPAANAGGTPYSNAWAVGIYDKICSQSRLTGPDVIYFTIDLNIDSQNTKHSNGSSIMIPMTVNPGGL